LQQTNHPGNQQIQFIRLLDIILSNRIKILLPRLLKGESKLLAFNKLESWHKNIIIKYNIYNIGNEICIQEKLARLKSERKIKK
jgi:hypothetical protein